MKTCGSCGFFGARRGRSGRCRRYPPTPVYVPIAILSASPEVDDDHWCGEWQAAQDQREISQ